MRVQFPEPVHQTGAVAFATDSYEVIKKAQAPEIPLCRPYKRFYLPARIKVRRRGSCKKDIGRS